VIGGASASPLLLARNRRAARSSRQHHVDPGCVPNSIAGWPARVADRSADRDRDRTAVLGPVFYTAAPRLSGRAVHDVVLCHSDSCWWHGIAVYELRRSGRPGRAARRIRVDADESFRVLFRWRKPGQVASTPTPPRRPAAWRRTVPAARVSGGERLRQALPRRTTTFRRAGDFR